MDAGSPLVTVTRTYRFAAAHHYYDASLSPADNLRLFGKCANRAGHGHNYRIDVVLRGTPQPATGMLVDLRELDRSVRDAVLEPLDHRNLNAEVEWFAAHQPTVENLAVWIWRALAPSLADGLLAAVRVYEADDLWAEHGGQSLPAARRDG
jgi:6-pyruvoyltetrahydropterin/6-carboxytetrahydropterin synthase